MKGRWFTNSTHPKADAYDWARWSGATIIIGEPQTTPRSASIAQLVKWKMRGLYEVTPGHTPLPTEPP